VANSFLTIGVKDEQQAVERLYFFLTSSVGWQLVQDVSDTGTDRDVVLSSSGEPEVPNGLTRYIRLRGTGNSIKLYTYETFSNISSFTGELSDSTYGLINTEADSQGFSLTAVADLERVVIHVETYDGVRYLGYVGRINSYYSVYDFRYPNLVKGCQSTTYDWYYSAAERNSWMLSSSGTVDHYYSMEPANSTSLTAGLASDRNGSFFLAAPVLIHPQAHQDLSEVVGEPRGIYRISEEVAQNQMLLDIGGSVYVVLGANSKFWAVGPVTSSGTGVAAMYTGPEGNLNG